MKKNDILVILIGLIMAAAAWFMFNKTRTEPKNSMVVIYKDGNLYRTLSLFEDEIVRIEDEDGRINIISIKDGKADMIEANCQDKICVNTRAAHKDGQSIVCLPNRVVVEIKGAEEDIIDGVSE
ncbi:MAG: NusG domain II-containing protein [Clostridiaceae bacterium]|jgi:hypothetical protein|nr:NusG domain II-containing protein [Clostridiaceae bacterium]